MFSLSLITSVRRGVERMLSNSRNEDDMVDDEVIESHDRLLEGDDSGIQINDLTTSPNDTEMEEEEECGLDDIAVVSSDDGSTKDMELDTCISPYDADTIEDKMTEVLFHTPGCFPPYNPDIVEPQTPTSLPTPPTQLTPVEGNDFMIHTLLSIEPFPCMDVKMRSPSPPPQSRKRKRADDDHDIASSLSEEEVEIIKTRVVRKSPRVRKLSYKLKQSRDVSTPLPLSSPTSQSMTPVQNTTSPTPRTNTNKRVAKNSHDMATINQPVRRSTRIQKTRDLTTPRRLSLRSRTVSAPVSKLINDTSPLVTRSTPRSVITRSLSRAAGVRTKNKPVAIPREFSGVKKKRGTCVKSLISTRRSETEINPSWMSPSRKRSTTVFGRNNVGGYRGSQRKRRKIISEEGEVIEIQEMKVEEVVTTRYEREISVDLYTGQPVVNINRMDVGED